jgi:hypothetical protein
MCATELGRRDESEDDGVSWPAVTCHHVAPFQRDLIAADWEMESRGHVMAESGGLLEIVAG